MRPVVRSGVKRSGRRWLWLLPMAFAVLSLALASGSARSQPEPRGSIRGVVTDSTTTRPISHVSVILDADQTSVLTDSSGRFQISGVDRGLHSLTFRHVSYHPRSEVVVLATPDAAVEVQVSLLSRAHEMAEITVEADRVRPLTSGTETRYTIPRTVLTDLPIADEVELVRLVPGVTVLGDRPFLRGIGFEHVEPLIDGVPARDPLEGGWIVPPTGAIGQADVIAGAFDGQYGSLGGAIDIRLAEGGPVHRSRLRYDSDRFEVGSSTDTRTDNVEVSVSGPTGLGAITFAAAWKGLLTDTHLTLDHGLPDQDVLGVFSLGDRMRGRQTGSLRLALAPDGAPWKTTVTLLHTALREKPYHDNYSLAGWVGFEEQFQRYTTFLTSPDEADSVVVYDGPDALPVRERVSTLGMATYARTLGNGGAFQLHARVAHHRYDTDTGRAIESTDDIRQWIREHTTRPNYQTEWFYATHGDFPDFFEAEREEAAAGARSTLRLGRHTVAVGAGGTLGRHRHAGVVWGGFSTSQPIAAGSFDGWIDTFDGYAYLQDTWRTDALSSVQVALRLDARRLGGYQGGAWGRAMSPRVSFNQPMTDVNALHVQAGILYQFPHYESYMRPAADPARNFTLVAQRTRAFEAGIQHHFSRQVVAYLAGYLREYDRVVFSVKDPSQYDLIFSSGTGPGAIVSRGFELTLDHRFHPAVTGQVSATIGKTDIGGNETPWSRGFTTSGRLMIRPLPGLRVGTSWFWTSGRSYTVCLTRDCLGSGRATGRIPDTLSLDLATSWSLTGRQRGIRVLAEVRNVLDQRLATFDFGLVSSNVSVDNFIAYYAATGTAGGYMVPSGDGFRPVHIDNPQTRTAGRDVRLGLEMNF